MSVGKPEVWSKRAVNDIRGGFLKRHVVRDVNGV